MGGRTASMLAAEGYACDGLLLFAYPLHPAGKPRQSYLESVLAKEQGIFLAASDYMRSVPEMITRWVPGGLYPLGTDGFGRSDYRVALRNFFEVNRHYVAIAALNLLADEGAVPKAKVSEAITKYGIDPDRPAPWTV